jgi:hypothetical protein
MDTNITKVLTKEVMQQYEFIRSTGLTNMFDYYNVMAIAKKLGCKELGNLTLENYKSLLMNFSKLMKEYDINQ